MLLLLWIFAFLAAFHLVSVVVRWHQMKPTITRGDKNLKELHLNLVRSSREGDRLSPEEEIEFMRGVPGSPYSFVAHCPDCGSRLEPGPTAGTFVNFSCLTIDCGSCFNYMGPFGIERLTDAQPWKGNDHTHREGAYR